MDKSTTTNHQFKCQECGNDIELQDDLSMGDFFECEFCGIEYEVTASTDDGEYEVMIVEEEK